MVQEPQLTGVDLWTSLVDELKLPLLQIARAAELAEAADAGPQLRLIETAADNALRLIDAYLLVSDLQRQGQLPLEPVSVTATLYDVAQDLYELSKLYDTTINIRVHGATGQAMAHGPGLRAALTSLAYTFLTGGLKLKHQTLTLMARRDRGGITTGVLSPTARVASDDLQRARRLFGRAAQPAGGLTQNSGVGLYMADNLFEAMEAPLHVIRAARQTGLVATLPPSQQLALL